MSSLRRTAPALALALALALTGCGGEEEEKKDTAKSPETSTSSPTATEPASPWEGTAPAQGLALGGDAYGFKAVKGWTDATKDAKAVNQMVQVAASAAPDATGFANNVNVVVSDAGVEEPSDDQMSQISAAIKKELVKLAPQLKVNEPTELAGQPALDHEGAAARKDVKYYIHQYVAFRQGKAYTITFSFSRATTPQQRAGIINPVMASWTWK